ncbi:MAG: hypothetical protein M0P27_07420 [Bacteroidales bacterium]|nr:hypothetical protein [Bacteroidales bacterium]
MKLFKKIDDALNGWLIVILLIFLEIIVVYTLSNIPFFLATLDVPIVPTKDVDFLDKFINVLESEISKGQLLTFVCTLIAPVVFWSLSEYRKALMTKALSFSALILLGLTAYLHGKGDNFQTFNGLHLYLSALTIWVVSIFCNRIPPDRKAYANITDNQENDFLKLTRG